MLFAAALVLLLPGLAWLAWFPHPEQDAASRLADASALSISLTGLAALALFLLKIQLNTLSIAGIYASLALLTAAGWLRRPQIKRNGVLTLAAALGLMALVTAWRLYQARSLVLPAWVDSVHHVLIVRLFLQNGGIPVDFSPYLPVPFSYHYAFHAVGALFSLISGVEPARAVLVLGQILNGLISLQVYRLGRAVWPGTTRPLIAALLTAFATQMPAYYLTWGRYTLVTGLIVLAAAASAALELAHMPARRETALRLAVLTAGALLAHYLGAILLAVLFMVLAGFWLFAALRSRQPDWPALRGWILAGAAGFLAALPWILRVWQYNQASFQMQLNLSADAPDQIYFPNYLDYLWYLEGPLRNYYLIGLGLLGALLVLRRGASPASRWLAVWWLAVILLTVPWGLRLGPFRPDHMAIIWFLPASLFAAHLLVSAAEASRRLPRLLAWVLPAAACLGLLIWGLRDTANILNQATVFVQPADAPALTWIKDNTPPSARFWINTTHWQGGTFRGVDGGWWITPLTDRGTLLPVVFYQQGGRDFAQQINRWASEASTTSDCTPGFYQIIQAAGLTHVYLREGSGSLQPQAADACPGLERLYRAGGVSIYRVVSVP